MGSPKGARSPGHNCTNKTQSDAPAQGAGITPVGDETGMAKGITAVLGSRQDTPTLLASLW